MVSNTAVERLKHDINCDYWTDQYPFECCCGLTRPRHPDFVPHKLPERDALTDQQPSVAATTDITKKE